MILGPRPTAYAQRCFGPLKGLAMVLGLAAAADTSAAQASTQAPQLVGRWTTPGDRSVVEFGSCAEQRIETLICGRIVALRDPSARDRRDIHNPSAANRSRRVLGLQIVQGLRETAPGIWTGADLYNPDDGRTYRGAVRFRGADSLELKGCALAIICQTQVWRRVEP